MVYIFDTLVILKHRQGHQTYNENVDLEQSYNHAKYERFLLNSVREKGNVKVFLQRRKYVSYVPWACAGGGYGGGGGGLWHIPYLFDVISNGTKFQLDWVWTWNFKLELFDTAVTLKYSQGGINE